MVIDLILDWEAYYNSSESQALKAKVRILNSSFLRKTVTMISFFLKIILTQIFYKSKIRFKVNPLCV